MRDSYRQNDKSLAKHSSNHIYGDIRDRYSENDPRANGYRLYRYFQQEQKFIFSELGEQPGMVLDIACGSGILTFPLSANGFQVYGLDFNKQACDQASMNGLMAVTGNAYCLPFEDSSFDRIVCCQFFNQQPDTLLDNFFSECHRVIRVKGEVLLLWRNGNALIHKLAHFYFKLQDKLVGREAFPVYSHALKDFIDRADRAGFEIHSARTFMPLIAWQSENYDGFKSRMIGASNYLRLVRLAG